MQDEPIFSGWRPEHAALWGKVALKLRHDLPDNALFSDASLAQLIETYPRAHYQLMQPGQTPGERSRDGDVSGVAGKDVIAAIAKGRLWINLRNVAAVDARYDALMTKIFAEIEAQVPGFTTLSRTIGILVSSPNSQTHYHADLPGQSLFQIRGRKRLYLYPPSDPFISREQIEKITVSRKEFIRYEPWYDAHAQVLELEPGDMIHWPLNAPHRVDNHDCLNVSMTMEFFTPAIRRQHIVNRANGIMRILKITPRSTAAEGLDFYAKAALQRALRGTSLVRRHDAMRVIDPVFRPDPSRPEAVADLL